MRNSTGGRPVPVATYTLLIANQAVGAAATFTSAAIPLNNAPLANSLMVASARAALPATAGGCQGVLACHLTADNSAVVTLTNAAAAALVATAADIVIDILALPLTP